MVKYGTPGNNGLVINVMKLIVPTLCDPKLSAINRRLLQTLD